MEQEHRAGCDDRILITVRSALDDFAKTFNESLKERDARLVMEIKREMEIIAGNFHDKAIDKAVSRAVIYIDGRFKEVFRSELKTTEEIKAIHKSLDYAEECAKRQKRWNDIIVDWILKGSAWGVLILVIYFISHFSEVMNNPMIQMFTNSAKR